MTINSKTSSSSKRNRFEKVASNRVSKIIGLLDLLGNCANKHNYDYSEKDVELMFREINRALKESRAQFSRQRTKSNKSIFKF